MKKRGKKSAGARMSRISVGGETGSPKKLLLLLLLLLLQLG
jgi:hypothetical protein